MYANQQIVRSNIHGYMLRILLSYSISGQFPEGWNSQDHENYLRANHLSLHLSVFSFDGAQLTEHFRQELQTDLMKLGYALPKYGADGDYGAETEKAVKQFQLSEQDHGEHIACLEARKHFAWYLRGVSHSSFYKKEISSLSTMEDIYRVAKEVVRDLK